jgi:uncharacterized membrane protein
MTDGAVIIYTALFLICIVFNRKWLRAAAWLPPGAFFMFQIYIVSTMSQADETSLVLMVLLALIAFVRTWTEYSSRDQIKNEKQ